MRQNDLVGVLPTADQLAAVQPSLHYARHVLLMDTDDSATLPPVGRGRAVAGAAGWRAHVGRATVVVGTDAQLSEMLHDLRSAVVAVVCGTAGASVERVNALAATHEAHVVQLGAEPLRVIVSDAGQVSVQAWDGEWRSLTTVVTAAPEATRKKRRTTTEPAPTPVPTAADTGEAGAAAEAVPTPQDEIAPQGNAAQNAQEQ
tara:strand:+ start:104 stop:709 length:606 start_codon:yes stop_codon:yes gene_type:complete